MVRHSVYFNYVLVPLDLIINLNRRGIEMYGSSGWFDLWVNGTCLKDLKCNSCEGWNGFNQHGFDP